MMRSWLFRSSSRVSSSVAFFSCSSSESCCTRSSCMARMELCRSVSRARQALDTSSLPLGSMRYSKSPIPRRRIQASTAIVRIPTCRTRAALTSVTASGRAGQHDQHHVAMQHGEHRGGRQESDDQEDQQEMLNRIAPDGELRQPKRVVAFEGLVGDRVRAVHRVNLSWDRFPCALGHHAPSPHTVVSQRRD